MHKVPKNKCYIVLKRDNDTLTWIEVNKQKGYQSVLRKYRKQLGDRINKILYPGQLFTTNSSL